MLGSSWRRSCQEVSCSTVVADECLPGNNRFRLLSNTQSVVVSLHTDELLKILGADIVLEVQSVRLIVPEVHRRRTPCSPVFFLFVFLNQRAHYLRCSAAIWDKHYFTRLWFCSDKAGLIKLDLIGIAFKHSTQLLWFQSSPWEGLEEEREEMR